MASVRGRGVVEGCVGPAVAGGGPNKWGGDTGDSLGWKKELRCGVGVVEGLCGGSGGRSFFHPRLSTGLASTKKEPGTWLG